MYLMLWYRRTCPKIPTYIYRSDTLWLIVRWRAHKTYDNFAYTVLQTSCNDKSPVTQSNQLFRTVVPRAKISRQCGTSLLDATRLGQFVSSAVADNVVQLRRCIAKKCRKTAFVIRGCTHLSSCSQPPGKTDSEVSLHNCKRNNVKTVLCYNRHQR